MFWICSHVWELGSCRGAGDYVVVTELVETRDCLEESDVFVTVSRNESKQEHEVGSMQLDKI